MIVSISTLFSCVCLFSFSVFFFFNHTATSDIYTLSLHDALPILVALTFIGLPFVVRTVQPVLEDFDVHCEEDRKSTRLNSSHLGISYAVFCLKKKKKNPRRESGYQQTKKQTHDTCTHSIYYCPSQ